MVDFKGRRHSNSSMNAIGPKTFAFVLLLVATFSMSVVAQQYYQWSEWKGTNASGINYRYEITGPYIVMIQFQNTTANAVSIDYDVWVPNQDKPQKGSLHIDSNSTVTGNNIQTTNGQSPSRVEVQLK